MKVLGRIVPILALAQALAACNNAAPTAQVDPAVKAEADQIFTTRCAPCHGDNGEGNGPASAALQPKPRNFKDKPWQYSITDEHIDKIIAEGGAAVGKSAAMPPNPDLVAKPEVVKALRLHVRSFAQ